MFHADLTHTTVHDEHGFTLLEAVIVLTVTMVLVAIAVPTFLKQKSDSQMHSTRAAALVYDQAISEFAQDNSNMYPQWNTSQWPVTTASEKGRQGPVNQLQAALDSKNGTPAKSTYYMGGTVPDYVQATTGTGRASIGNTYSGWTASNGAPNGEIVYLSQAGGGGVTRPQYELLAYFKGKALCYRGSIAGGYTIPTPAGAPATSTSWWLAHQC